MICAMSAEPDIHNNEASEDLDGPKEFTCPRCRLQVTEEYYGPCQSCRTTLRATVGGVGRDVEEVAYEPKMNVTPNAVASKE